VRAHARATAQFPSVPLVPFLSLLSSASNRQLWRCAPVRLSRGRLTVKHLQEAHVLPVLRGDVSSVLQCCLSAVQVDSVKEKNEANPVIVYSKSWCPYCARVRDRSRS